MPDIPSNSDDQKDINWYFAQCEQDQCSPEKLPKEFRVTVMTTCFKKNCLENYKALEEKEMLEERIKCISKCSKLLKI